jgi:hypothetical protein
VRSRRLCLVTHDFAGFIGVHLLARIAAPSDIYRSASFTIFSPLHCTADVDSTLARDPQAVEVAKLREQVKRSESAAEEMTERAMLAESSLEATQVRQPQLPQPPGPYSYNHSLFTSTSAVLSVNHWQYSLRGA